MQFSKNPILDDIMFLIVLLFELMILPLKLIFFIFKGQPRLAFKRLKELLHYHVFKKHKQVFILMFINLIVFLFLNFLRIFPFVFNLALLFSTSNSLNFYIFNLSFISHLNLYHLLSNMIWLYYFGSVLSYKHKNLIKLYFWFGFLGNIINAIFHFLGFLPNRAELGASGVIFAFSALALIEYPFAFNILPFLLCVIFYSSFFYLNAFNILTFIYEFQSIGKIDYISHEAHVIGFTIGLLYEFFHRNKLSKFSKLMLWLSALITILIIVTRFI